MSSSSSYAYKFANKNNSSSEEISGDRFAHFLSLHPEDREQPKEMISSKDKESSGRMHVLNSSLKGSESIQKSGKFDAMIQSLNLASISKGKQNDTEDDYEEDFEEVKDKVEEKEVGCSDQSGFYQEDFEDEYQDEEFEDEVIDRKNENDKFEYKEKESYDFERNEEYSMDKHNISGSKELFSPVEISGDKDSYMNDFESMNQEISQGQK